MKKIFWSTQYRKCQQKFFCIFPGSIKMFRVPYSPSYQQDFIVLHLPPSVTKISGCRVLRNMFVTAIKTPSTPVIRFQCGTNDCHSVPMRIFGTTRCHGCHQGWFAMKELNSKILPDHR